MSRLISFFMTLAALLLMHSLNAMGERASVRRHDPVAIGRPILR